MDQIKEKEAINLLIQVYLSHTSKWYSSLTTTVIGAIGTPLLIFSLKAVPQNEIKRLYLHLFSFMTVAFVLASLYFFHKIIYSLDFLKKLYKRLSIIGSGKSVDDYRNRLMREMKEKSLIFRFLVKRKKIRGKKAYVLHNAFFVSSFIAALTANVLFLSFIWMPLYANIASILIWETFCTILIAIYIFWKIV
jgi:FlaA1/EpsC-like NDP-sugar epimerase